MKNKSLNHIPHTFAQMFCGWQGACGLEQEAILRLGSGCLKINILDVTAEFNGSATEPLPIVEILRDWLSEECQTHTIDVRQIRKAELIVNLAFSNQGKRGWTALKRGDVWGFDCKGVIETDEGLYKATFVKTLKWQDGHNADVSEG